MGYAQATAFKLHVVLKVLATLLFFPQHSLKDKDNSNLF